MSVGAVPSSMGDFFLRPTNLVKGSGLRAKVSKVCMGVLSALVFLGTVGLAHLIALGVHSWKSGGGPGAKKVNDKALESLQMPLPLNPLHPKNLFQGTLKQRLDCEAAVTRQKDVKVPAFVRSCIAFLEEGKNLGTEGIYRQRNLEQQYRVSEKQYVQYVQTYGEAPKSSEKWMPGDFTEHRDKVLFAAYALKSYCGSMWRWSEETLKTQKLQLVKPPDISSDPSSAKVRLQKLPQEERAVLLEIFTHLRKLAKGQKEGQPEEERLSAEKFEILWAPNLHVEPGDITYLVGHPEVNLQQFLGLEGK